jgi:DNA-binding LytR/AlgR family response regulator
MKAVIIEDELLVGKELENLIHEVAEDVDVLDILPSLKVARKWFLYNAEPDLLFMDIQLSDGVSFALFDQFKLQCPVIFTTAYDEYAIRAFKVNGVDYLLKPVESEELKKAIDKCRMILSHQPHFPSGIEDMLRQYQISPQPTPLYKEKFIVHFRNQWLPVKTSEIACFGKETLFYLFTFSGEKHILDVESMDEIESLVDPQQFYRANRQWLVHQDAIQSISPRENSKLVLTLKPPLKITVDISREKAPGFKKWFDR